MMLPETRFFEICHAAFKNVCTVFYAATFRRTLQPYCFLWQYFNTYFKSEINLLKSRWKAENFRDWRWDYSSWKRPDWGPVWGNQYKTGEVCPNIGATESFEFILCGNNDTEIVFTKLSPAETEKFSVLAAELCADKGFSRIIIYYLNKASSNSLANSFKFNAMGKKISIVSRDSYELTTPEENGRIFSVSNLDIHSD